MNTTKAIDCIVLVALMVPGIGAANDVTLALTKNGKSYCTIVAITGDKPDLLMTQALESITRTVRRWRGVDLPIRA